MFSFTINLIIVVMLLAFICEYTDSTLGMGYGTTLTPVLLLMGYQPMQIIPVVLVSELITGMLAGGFHQAEGNVDFRDKTIRKSTTILGLCGLFGAIFAVVVAVNLPKFWLKMYVGTMVTSIGIFLVATLNKTYQFSWKKLWTIGLLASFNKGTSGGGYGPLVTSGQIVSGVDCKSAVGVTSVAESLTCLFGIIAYMLISKKTVDWYLAPSLIIGAVCSVPLSAKSVKLIPDKMFKGIVAFGTIILGIFTIVKTLLN